MSDSIRMLLTGTPTYRGIEMRSFLETRYARFLDDHGIKWQYEPGVVVLPNGARYLPDFWLPELRTIFEVKGVYDSKLRRKVVGMAMLPNVRVVLALPESCNFFGPTLDGTLTDEVHLVRCRGCLRWFWYDECGEWGCPACGHLDTSKADYEHDERCFYKVRGVLRPCREAYL